MFTHQTFSKLAPVSSAVILEVIGASAKGFALWIANQDAVNTLTYSVESSDDGVTWTPVAFPVYPTGTSTTFAILANDQHLIKVCTGTRWVHVIGYGSVQMELSLTFNRPSTNLAAPVEVLY